MARGSSLSDDRVINEINQNFIAVEDNITVQGFPQNMPALRPWQRYVEKTSDPDGVHHKGFTTSVVISSDGRVPLGTSGSGYIREVTTSVCYVPDKYLSFLKETGDRYRRLRQIASDSALNPGDKSTQVQKLMTEVYAEMHNRNLGGEG